MEHRSPGRSEIEIENMIGLFVNTLVFRADFTHNLSFRELVRQTRSFALEAYNHQDVPFEKLVEELIPQRSLETHPLFQVMFTFQNIPKQVFEIPGLKIKEMGFEAGIAKFDLSVEVWENEEFHCQIEYNTDLFEQSTIRRMLGHFEKLLSTVVENPDLTVAQIPIMSARRAATGACRLESDCGRLSQGSAAASCIRGTGRGSSGCDSVAVRREKVELSRSQ